MARTSNLQRRSARARWLALAWAVWVVLVQALGGTTAMVHSHAGTDEHVHFVASQVNETDHGEWHRRAHGAAEESDAALDASEGALELLLAFPDAPQLSCGGASDLHDVAGPAQCLAWRGAESLASLVDGERAELHARARARARPRAGPTPPLPLRI